MRKRERLLAVWVSYNIWKILNLQFRVWIFQDIQGSDFLGGSEFFGGLRFGENQGVWVFETSSAPNFSGVGVFDTPGESEFSIHPGGLCFRYTQGVCVFWGVCVFDTPRGFEILGGSVFSIHPGGQRFLGGLCFRYTQGVWVFWGGLCFQCAQGSEFFGVWELCFRGLSFRNTPNLLCFAYRIK